MPKELQGLLFTKIELCKEPNTFSNRRAIRKIDRKIKKVVKRAAKEQAQIMYAQTYELLYNVINANFR